MRIRITHAAVVLLVLLVPGVCPGAELHVPSDYSSIAAAIADAVDGDEIIVGPGTFFGEVDFVGKEIHIRSSEGPDATTLDGGGQPRTVNMDAGEGPGAILEGFTVTGACGYSLWMENSSGQILDNVFDNVDGACSNGNRVRIFAGAPYLAGNVFQGIENGVATLAGSLPTFVGNTFEDGYNGALHVINSNALVVNCTFAYNTSESDAAGILLGNSVAVVDRCRFVQNIAQRHGGALFVNGSNLFLNNCTVVDNFGGDGGGGVHGQGGSSVTIYQSIIHGNTATIGGPQIDQETCCGFVTVAATYSDIEGGWPGEGNIDADPLLGAPAALDFGLMEHSPCRDAGDPLGSPDLDGSVADMGAVPYYAAPPVPFRRGDCNGSGVLGLDDAIFILQYFFQMGSPEPDCLLVCDVDDDDDLNIADPIYALSYLFSGGPPPPPPLDCGLDPTPILDDCEQAPSCP